VEGEEALTRRELLSCMELGKALTAELNSERLFGRILQKVTELLPAENWSLLLMDEKTGDLRFELVVGLDPQLIRDVRLRPGEGIAGQVALRQEPMVVEDVKKTESFSSQVDQISGSITEAVICVPLIFGGKTLGVIEVINPRSLQDKALPLLSIIADYAAIAVENMRRYHRIQDLAVRDNLTGLYNTRHLYKALGELIRESSAKGRPFSLIFMDMDNFKSVVDTYGHLNGSRALQEVAGTIKECLSEPAFGVAYGGDEFVGVFPGFHKDRAMQKAGEIWMRMAKTSYLSDHGHNLRIHASFGVATFPDDATDLTGMLALADQAMFHVKREGKNAIRSA
jgi:diguanylate cyclase (GGDEF)-like protein